MKALDWDLGNNSFLESLAKILQIILSVITALVSLLGGQSV